MIKIIKDENFPNNPIKALQRGFYKAESVYLNICEDNGDKSGSCAVVILLIGKSDMLLS
jgi:hypothetical protein